MRRKKVKETKKKINQTKYDEALTIITLSGKPVKTDYSTVTPGGRPKLINFSVLLNLIDLKASY